MLININGKKRDAKYSGPAPLIYRFIILYGARLNKKTPKKE